MMSGKQQQQQQRPGIHPKLRGKLENWQRNQAALAAGSGQESASNSGGESVGGNGNSKSKGEHIVYLILIFLELFEREECHEKSGQIMSHRSA